jgi:hypothetical protein
MRRYMRSYRERQQFRVYPVASMSYHGFKSKEDYNAYQRLLMKRLRGTLTPEESRVYFVKAVEEARARLARLRLNIARLESEDRV